MSYTRITTFITIGSERYQNSTIGSVNGHQFLSFIYQGAAKNRTGDNIESSLILSANLLSMNEARRAVAQKASVKVETYVMNSTFTETEGNAPLTEENWIAASMSYDTETIEILLSSAIDAVGANAPNRVLTRDLVGDLPVSGTITNR
jgi:hypothetical protein